MSFARADKELCFDRIRPELRMPDEHLHFPIGDLAAYSRTYDAIRCVVMQGGQGEVKHWAFNDPPKREGRWQDAPPPPDEYRKLAARVTDLHPMTVIQNARTSGGGHVGLVPTRAATVGPVETWKAEKVSIWQAGRHDNPFGMRLTAWMIRRRIARLLGAHVACWPIIRTCSSTSTARASAWWRRRCIRGERGERRGERK